MIPRAGHARKDTGTFVKAILSHSEKSLPGKTTIVPLGVAWSYPQLLQIWAMVTGKKITYLECSKEQFASLCGDVGLELALQYEFIENVGEKLLDDRDVIEPSDRDITRLVRIEDALKELEVA